MISSLHSAYPTVALNISDNGSLISISKTESCRVNDLVILYLAFHSVADNQHTKLLITFLPCCSDFRYESNGIFVLGVGFFSSDKFRLFN